MMQSSRYQDAAREIGVSDEKAIKEQEKIRLAHEKEELRRLKKEQKRKELMGSSLFQMMNGIKRLFDDWYLDAIIGFIPTVGDIVGTLLSFPFIMFCVFKVRSIALTLAVLNNYMFDMILGLVPFWIGNIIDIFYKAHRQNLDLIMGYINDDEYIIEEVNRKAVSSAIILAVLIAIFILMIKLVSKLVEWVGSLF